MVLAMPKSIDQAMEDTVESLGIVRVLGRELLWGQFDKELLDMVSCLLNLVVSVRL
jgi:hypothetical protein